MDENWPLFAATIIGREPTENEALLLAASRRLWPAALATTIKHVAESSGPSLDSKSITTECWEKTLFSTMGTMEKLGATKILNLDAYLFVAFTRRLNQYLERERKKRQTESTSRSEALAELPGVTDESWVERLESDIALQQALSKMDDSFRAMAWLFTREFRWDEIGLIFRVTSEQARKRFEYGVQKLRRLLENPPEEEDESE
jgi:DNA-directed RNA polymerase specialized sigma24 family protein